MKIGSSQINYQTAHQEQMRLNVQEKLEMWRDQNTPEQTVSPLSMTTQPQRVQQFNQEGQHKTAVHDHHKKTKQTDATEALQETDDDVKDPHLGLVKQLLEALIGSKMNISQVKLEQEKQSVFMMQNQNEQNAVPNAEGNAPTRAGWGMRYDYAASYQEVEQTHFQVAGTIQTQDNKSIQFELQLNMKREYAVQVEEHIRLGDAKLTDPLVLNFKGTAAELHPTERFSFDLNRDGQTESIAQLAAGNGFLVLDRNKNGKIDDGSELFGPQTGVGIQELAAYDSDKNNWIDENDPIYQWLQVWAPQEAADSLRSLKEMNVGALYLEQIGTPFSLKDKQNQTLGQIKSSGLFLNEQGQAGVMQQLDLATK